ncbi:MAG: hypothetical protein IJN78_08470 [Clostridia bacterium]|nr:hypothetical protein [Clostridia bacterium]
MANCPKCGKKLGLFNFKPECPNCGVNLLYYKIEERLEVDAINAELEHAKTQQRIDRVKNAIFGSPLSIVRLVLILLVVGTFFLPLATLHTVGPLFDDSVTFNALEIYNKVSAMDFDGLFAMFGSPLLGKAFIFLAVSMVTIVLAVLMALLSLILSILSSSPKGFVRNMFFAIFGIVSTVASIVCYNLFISNITPVFPGLVEGGVGFGAYCIIAAFALVVAINVIIKVKGINVKYKQSYIDSIPYEVFVDKFGIKKYDLQAVEDIKDEFIKLNDEYKAEKTA